MRRPPLLIASNSPAINIVTHFCFLEFPGDFFRPETLRTNWPKVKYKCRKYRLDSIRFFLFSSFFFLRSRPSFFTGGNVFLLSPGIQQYVVPLYTFSVMYLAGSHLSTDITWYSSMISYISYMLGGWYPGYIPLCGTSFFFFFQ